MEVLSKTENWQVFFTLFVSSELSQMFYWEDGKLENCYQGDADFQS